MLPSIYKIVLLRIIMYLVQLRKRWGHYVELAWAEDLDQAHQIGQKEVLRFLAASDLNSEQKKLVGYLIVWLAPGGQVKYIPAKDNPWSWSDRIVKNSVEKYVKLYVDELE